MNTRREIIKAGAGLAAILATGRAPAAIVRSMLAMRNASAGGKPLPYDSEVEYLRNTSGRYADIGDGNPGNVGSYIDTGIYPIGNAEVHIGLRMDAINAYQCLFGCYDSNTKNFGIVTHNNTTYFLCGNQVNASGFTWGPNVVYDITFDAASNSMSVNGTYKHFSTGGFSGRSNGKIYLFTNNAVETTTKFNTTYTLKGDIFYFKYFENGVIVRDYHPVRFNNADGIAEGAMYDRANPDGGPLGNGLYPSTAANAPFVGACIGPDGTLQIGGGSKRRLSMPPSTPFFSRGIYINARSSQNERPRRQDRARSIGA